MDKQAYIIKQNEKALELLLNPPSEDDPNYNENFAIWHLRLMLTEIHPYSLSWRSGKIKAIKHAIKALEEMKSRHLQTL